MQSYADRTHAKAKNITNSSAKNTHQNTDTRKGIVIGRRQ